MAPGVLHFYVNAAKLRDYVLTARHIFFNFSAKILSKSVMERLNMYQNLRLKRF